MALKVVLDTNVVLDLVVFDEPEADPLRKAIESGRVTLLTRADCLDELRRVLAYPRFALDHAAQVSAFEWMEAHATAIVSQAPDARLPRCRDADDQKFLDLAWTAGAHYLVTKDRALLELGRRVARMGRFLVSLPTELPLATR